MREIRCAEERRAVRNRKRKIGKSLFWGVFIFVVGGIGMSPATAQVCVSPPDGLISWWPLDERSGSTAADIVDSNPGDVIGATFTSGKVGNALSFDGDDYVEIADAANLDVGSAWSVDFWVNPTEFPPPGHVAILINKWKSSREDKLVYLNSEGRVGSFPTKWWRCSFKYPSSHGHVFPCGSDV